MEINFHESAKTETIKVDENTLANVVILLEKAERELPCFFWVIGFRRLGTGVIKCFDGSCEYLTIRMSRRLVFNEFQRVEID